MDADPVDEAFRATPREDFLPPRLRERAAYDGPLDIGHGQTCSQPRTVAAMLRLLAVEPGQRVLDVGAGSGWTTALLAHLTGPTGEVVGVELEPDLQVLAERRVRAAGLTWATVRRARPGVLGWPEGAPYDRVLVSAEPARLPQELLDQLALGGRMVIPVAGTMLLARRGGPGEEPTVTRHGHYRFVPLR